MHQIKIPEKLIEVFFKDGEWNPCRYKGAYGGRGSAKTRTFAKMTAVRATQLAYQDERGVILCGREYQNSLDESSFAEIKNSILEDPSLSVFFEVGEKYIKTRCGRISFMFKGLKRNISSIKSTSRILIMWIDEAEPVSEACWRLITPTVRETGSEIWLTWNPERNGSPTDLRFRKDPPKDSCFVQMNWRDNPWFGQTALNDERLEDKEKRPDTYEHVWEGGYLEVKPGSYYVKQITKAKEEGRWLVDIPENPLQIIRLYIDIGGTGAKSDNFVIWATQFVGQNIFYVNHYEVQGQDFEHHLVWLRKHGYVPGRAKVFLPHDGETNDRVINVSYQSAFEDAGYDVVVVPNQGKGAAMKRVEKARNEFSRMWFDKKCKAGCSALSFYSKKIDDERGIDLGPNHDWSSHSADSHGLSAICYEEPKEKKKLKMPKIGIA